jgi:SAM-dependent methyltransferase
MERTVPPEILYSAYWYRSGTNDTMRNHLRTIAEEATVLVAKPATRVLDIGCNDGTLLGCYPADFEKFGVDPSDVTREIGGDITVIQDIFPSEELVKRLDNRRCDNHDSPLRSNRHLNMKIAVAAARVANGSKEKLLIGDLDAEKEFNFAGDVVAAMWLLIRQDELFECVVGSGQSHAVRDWIEACFREVGLDWNDYTETDRTYASPYRRLVSDPAKLLSLGWKPECTFSGLAAMMMAEAARRCEVSEPKADGP